jgi:acyl-CoA thioester hydrolase
MNDLYAEIELYPRFSEVDSMGVVWHGHYAKFFEDGREAFGSKYDLGYLYMLSEGFVEPIVEMNISYKKSVRYGQKIVLRTEYIPCASAKIKFRYQVFTESEGTRILVTEATTTQVFVDKEGNLMWESPEFYNQWKKKWGVSTI